MGVLLAFAVGYVVGAQGGSEGYEEIVTSLKSVRDSEEFKGLVSALRSHASYALTEIAQRLTAEAQQPGPVQEVLGRVRGLLGQDDLRETAS
jgi:hypothetical protein